MVMDRMDPMVIQSHDDPTDHNYTSKCSLSVPGLATGATTGDGETGDRLPVSLNCIILYFLYYTRSKTLKIKNLANHPRVMLWG